jgi:hypothetical protein
MRHPPAAAVDPPPPPHPHSGVLLRSGSTPRLGEPPPFGAFPVALSRNPSLAGLLFRYALLGFGLTEAIALFGLMVVFLILFAL